MIIGLFIYAAADGGCSRMYSEVYRAVRSVQIQSIAAKLIGHHYTVQVDNDSKHTVKSTQELLKAKKLNVLKWLSQPHDLNPYFLVTEDKPEGRNTHKQAATKGSCMKPWQSMPWEETRHVAMSLGSRLDAVIDFKGSVLIIIFIYSLVCENCCNS